MNKEQLNTDTESKILETAKDVFIQYGMDGARMQQIADKAGINKSLLHYYYRTKEKLFNSVLKFAFRQLMPNPAEFIQSDIPVFDKIRIFVDTYIRMLQKNRFIPLFVLHEINKNPDRMAYLIQEIGINPKVFAAHIQREIDAGIIKPVNPLDVIVNMLSMCVFPFAAQPLLQKLMYDDKPDDYNKFIENRKTSIADFIIESIKA